MKQLLPLLIIIILASLAAVVLVGTIFYVRPDLLGMAPPAVPADSAAVAHVRPDSLVGPRLTPGLLAEESAGAAESPSVGSKDSLMSVLTAALMRSDSLSERLRTVMDSTRAVTAATDSVRGVQRASMAKVLEVMEPVSAARILADFPDGDVKLIMLAIKKKQAAKILAALQPDRAARIMR